ncbi:MAG: response regulator [Candidatus Marinimicrobia bacterium]|nr:response regulator [Candidatus Neomarinimicrobiota bacterium]
MFEKDILLIDDSLTFCESIQEILEEKEWSVDFITDPVAGLKVVHEKEYKVILLDLKMPNISGLDFLKKLLEDKLINKTYVIVLTGEITIENAVDSLRLGAKDFIQKHAVVEYTDMFFERINKGFQWQHSRLENEKLSELRKQAVEESRLIVKSVGHDMSGSYYASLMLRLQMLIKQIEKADIKVKQALDNEEEIDLNKIKDYLEKSLEKGKSIEKLLGFFKELGQKLKYLGLAIDSENAHKKDVDINELIKDALHLFNDSAAGRNLSLFVSENLSDKPLIISASQEDMLRVFVNLFENAAKAMDFQGNLTVTTEKVDHKVIINVSDTGCGIPADYLDKIWRPDYTKWEGQQGTGLGLMICKKVVENHGGEISVRSQEKVGTTFMIKLDLI